jgi:hypothetical protein
MRDILDPAAAHDRIRQLQHRLDWWIGFACLGWGILACVFAFIYAT